MNPETIEQLFSRGTGEFFFARWGRPIVPVVFGVTDETLSLLKGACEAVVALAGHQMAETDPELGANLMIFFCRTWAELRDVPDLGRLVDGLDSLVDRLDAEEASQYRVFRFDGNGAVRACTALVRLDAALSGIPAETLALSQMVQTVLVWSDRAFAETSPLAALPDGGVIVKPEIAALLRAAYDPVLPPSARDASLALRLAARMGQAA